MIEFFILFTVAAVFYFLGCHDYKNWIQFQKEVIADCLKREEAWIQQNHELRSEIIVLKSAQNKN
jgi:hypothetical protein